MSNHKTVVKRHIQSEKCRLRNRAIKMSLNTCIKKAYVQNKDQSNQINNIRSAIKLMSSAVSKGIIHKKKASRNISKLAKYQNFILKNSS